MTDGPDFGKRVRASGVVWTLVFPGILAVAALVTGHIVLKMAVPLSCAGILVLAQRSGGRRDWVAVVGAFCLSAIGDWFLSNKSGHAWYFVVGIAFFFGAHVGYLVFAWRRGRPHGWVLAALLIVYLSYYVVALRPAITDPALSGASLGYLLISCLVLAAACGMKSGRRVKWPYVSAMGLIVLSDTIISFTEFLGYRALNPLILPTYYLAHLCATMAVVMWMRGGGTRSVLA